MNFISIDIETGGLSAGDHSLLEIGFVGAHDWRRIVLFDDTYSITPYCCRLHAQLLDQIAGFENDVKDRSVFHAGSGLYVVNMAHNAGVGAVDVLRDTFWACVLECLGLEEGTDDSIVVAGKNFAGFDADFLDFAGVFDDADYRFAHRVLDPGSMYARASDTKPPDLPECIRRAGLDPLNYPAHHAVGDAQAVYDVCRHFLTHIAPTT